MAISWLKKGAESAAIAKQEEAQTELRNSEQGKMFRFLLKKGEEARITFVDGELNSDGFLVPPRYYEHMVYLDSKWQTFVCPEKTAPHLGEKCPICASNDRPSLVSLFTVLDHREFKNNDGTKTYKDMPRLFVAKSGTMEMLNKIALKKGGLAGATFDVTRLNVDKSPAVGSMFEFVEKQEFAVLAAKYTKEFVNPQTNQKSMKSTFTPADYETEIVFRTAEELAKFGLGSAPVSGYGSNTGNSQSGDKTDYSSQL